MCFKFLSSIYKKCICLIKDKKSKISIIMPIYNMQKYLPDALNSAINQTHKNIEILCVDDGSTDNSYQILNEFALKDRRIKIIHFDKNQSTGFARNYALKKARGKYIMFLDPDDWYEPDTCEQAFKQISKYKNDFVIFNAYEYNENTKIKILKNLTDRFKHVPDITHIKSEQIPVCVTRIYSAWNKIYKRSFLSKNNIYFTETVSGEDQPFTILCFFQANSFSICEKPLYYLRRYREHLPDRVYTRWSDIYLNWERCYELVKQYDKRKIFMNVYLKYLIDKVIERCKYYNRKIKIQQKAFERSKKFLIQITSEQDIEVLKDKINYAELENFIKAESYDEFKSKSCKE